MSVQRAWWKEGVCYQVWPLSFKDSNGDGNGDIPGIVSKLDYLKDLGVDYVWLSPMYASPWNDYGYDISDYESVEPKFGTLQDMDDLIAGLQARGMKLILDLVVNHTSVQHHWFQESAKGKDNKFSNYYIWKDPKIVNGKKGPPNNWKCFMESGSAWKYVEARDQYYLHIFLTSMPDLNWEDEEVREAIFESAVKFWLDRGVSGFRIDVVNLYSKNVAFPDAPVTDPTSEFQQLKPDDIVNGPGMHKWLQEQRRKISEKFGVDIMLVGEAGGLDEHHRNRYLSPIDRELDIVFDFDIYKGGGTQFPKPWTEWTDNRGLPQLREALMKPQSFISDHGLWATTFFENHDQPRSVSNFGSQSDEYRWQSGRLLALLLASMSGTLFIYQGQEIGMSNVPSDWQRSDYRDPFWLIFLEDAEAKYPESDPLRKKAQAIFHRNNRDNARTPVQWSAEPYAGFSTTKPWIRINENFRDGVNVAAQKDDPDSLLNFWKRVLQFRKSEAETLIYGHTEFIDNENENIFSIVKHTTPEDSKSRKLLMVLNYSDDSQSFPPLSELRGGPGKYLFGTGPGADTSILQPWEGRIFEVTNDM